jgi:phage gp46-like protein
LDLQITLKDGIVDILPFGAAQPVNAAALSVLIPRGGWWQAPEFGSRLHTLLRSKMTANLAETVKNYLIEATGHLTETGLASRVDVETTATGRHRIDYKLTVYRGSKQVIFRWYWGEPEYLDMYKVEDIYKVENIYAAL